MDCVHQEDVGIHFSEEMGDAKVQRNIHEQQQQQQLPCEDKALYAYLSMLLQDTILDPLVLSLIKLDIQTHSSIEWRKHIMS